MGRNPPPPLNTLCEYLEAAGEFTLANGLRAACRGRSPILTPGLPPCVGGRWGHMDGAAGSVWPHSTLRSRGSSFQCAQSEGKSSPQITADTPLPPALHRKPAGHLIHTPVHPAQGFLLHFFSLCPFHVPTLFCMQHGKTMRFLQIIVLFPLLNVD